MSAGQFHWVMNGAHNGYMDALAQTAIIGLLLLIVFLLAALRAAYSAERTSEIHSVAGKCYGIYVTLGILLHDVTESTFVRAGAFFVVLFATAQLPAQSAENRRKRPVISLAGTR